MIINEIDEEIIISNDITKIDGDPIKILDSSIFRKNFPKFQFTSISDGIRNTLQYYRKRL